MSLTLKLTENHKEPYQAISPLRPELSQAGKTVLITGGSTGIGYAIAQAFILARASKVIIVGRRANLVTTAAASLSKESQAKSSGANPTKIVGFECDVGSIPSVAELWGRLAGEGTVVDVLVLNAAAVAPSATILELGAERIWADYNVNVRGNLDMAERFYKQQGAGAGRQYLVHVSTMGIHNWAVGAAYPGYGMTKNAGALALQVVAQDVAPERMQVLNFHPGAIFTESAEKAGYTRESIPWGSRMYSQLHFRSS